MPFNGSGTFNRLYSWVSDAANGIKIRADRMDNEMNGMATGLSTCVTRDGQSPATANLPMGGFGHTNVADASDLAMYPSLDQVIQQAYNFVTPSGTAAAIVADSLFPIDAYSHGQEIVFIAPNASVAGGTTINRDGVGAKTVQHKGAAIAVGDWAAGDMVVLKYDGTNFQLIAPVPTPDLTHLDGSWITTGTVASARGGAGTVNGLMKANGSGVVSQAVSNTDYLPATNPTCAGTFTAPDAATWTAAGIKGLVGLGIGFTGSLATIIDVRDNSNTGATQIRAQNTNAGTGVSIRQRCDNGTHIADVILFGTGFTSFGIHRQDGMEVSTDGAGGLTLGTTANQPVYVAVNGAEKARFGTDGSLIVGSTVNAGAGNVAATGTFIGAYSDERLKTREGDIKNALEKVKSLSTFYYRANDLAVELGGGAYRAEDLEIGLSAQEVEKVFPEVVVSAAIGRGYKTLRYDRLVTVSLAAINELQEQLQVLKNEIEELKSK